MAKTPDRLGHRINLTLPDEVVAVIDRMCAVTGMGRATVIRQWMETAAPTMLEISRSLELAKAHDLDAYKVLAKQIEGMASETNQIALDLRNKRRALMRKRNS